MVKQFIIKSNIHNLGIKIQKDELIQIHSFLLQLRLNLEDKIIDTKLNHFSSYDSLNISPHKVFKSKNEQELAIFELSRGISNLISEYDPSTFSEICSNLNETCNKLRKNR
jgi:hypothetical protein